MAASRVLEPRGHGGSMGREIAADGLVVRFERQVQFDLFDALQHVEVPADHGAAGLHDEPVRLQAGEHLQALARDPVLRLGALVGVRGGTQEYPHRFVPLLQTGHLGLEPFGRVDLDVHVVAPGPAVVEVDGQGLHVAVGATVHAADVGLQGMGDSPQGTPPVRVRIVLQDISRILVFTSTPPGPRRSSSERAGCRRRAPSAAGLDARRPAGRPECLLRAMICQRYRLRTRAITGGAGPSMFRSAA